MKPLLPLLAIASVTVELTAFPPPLFDQATG
jgi:hypothetical protein